MEVRTSISRARTKVSRVFKGDFSTLKLTRILLKAGVVLSVFVLLLIYTPLLFLRIRYLINRSDHLKSNEKISQLQDIDHEQERNNQLKADIEYINLLRSERKFGIVIPSIGVRALVKENVDPYDEKIYMAALNDAVAHAKGTKVPGKDGRIFIFAHSAMNFYRLATQNIEFYLINNLDVGENIIVTYKGEIFFYEVKNKALVQPDDIGYMTDPSDTELLVLMTCWPPGVDTKRLIVTAIPRVENEAVVDEKVELSEI